METRIQTRWPDFDALGHLNHAVYHVYLDEARDEALRNTVGDFDAWPNVVVHASIDYRREVALGVREIIVHTQIAEVERSLRANDRHSGRRTGRRGGGSARRVESRDAPLARDYACGATAPDGAVIGSSSPASKRNGGYSGVINAP
jgi:hypothetical protein